MSIEERKQDDVKSDRPRIDQVKAQPTPSNGTGPRNVGEGSAEPAGGPSTEPVVLLPPGAGSEPKLPPSQPVVSAQPTGEPAVHVAPDLLDLVTGATVTPAAAQAAREQRDLNEVVHRMLILGLGVSTAFMLIGLGLDLALGRELPTVVPSFSDVLGRAIALRPSGFLTLGLLVLIATPILRVVGSIAAFLYERDWRFAGITLLVLMVVTVSLVFGQG